VNKIVMVRKTKTTSPSRNSESSNETETEEKRFAVPILAFPIVMIFNLLKTILFELFIVLKFVYNSSSRILNKPAATTEVNLETVKADEQQQRDSMDLLQLQKNHHKRAFEFISQALKIDETQNTGENFNLSSTGEKASMNSNYGINETLTPLVMTHRIVQTCVSYH
jgi:hypothetical protein